MAQLYTKQPFFADSLSMMFTKIDKTDRRLLAWPRNQALNGTNGFFRHNEIRNAAAAPGSFRVMDRAMAFANVRQNIPFYQILREQISNTWRGSRHIAPMHKHFHGDTGCGKLKANESLPALYNAQVEVQAKRDRMLEHELQLKDFLKTKRRRGSQAKRRRRQGQSECETALTDERERYGERLTAGISVEVITLDQPTVTQQRKSHKKSAQKRTAKKTIQRQNVSSIRRETKGQSVFKASLTEDKVYDYKPLDDRMAFLHTPSMFRADCPEPLIPKERIRNLLPVGSSNKSAASLSSEPTINYSDSDETIEFLEKNIDKLPIDENLVGKMNHPYEDKYVATPKKGSTKSVVSEPRSSASKMRSNHKTLVRKTKDLTKNGLILSASSKTIVNDNQTKIASPADCCCICSTLKKYRNSLLDVPFVSEMRRAQKRFELKTYIMACQEKRMSKKPSELNFDPVTVLQQCNNALNHYVNVIDKTIMDKKKTWAARI